MQQLPLALLLLFMSTLVSAQEVFSGVFHQTEAKMIYAGHLSWEEMEARLASWKKDGYRPTEIESKVVDNQRRYWLIGTKSDRGAQLRQVTGWGEFVKLKREMADADFVLADIEAYALNEVDYHFVGIWHEGKTNHKIWKLDSMEGIEKKTREMGSDNYYPIHIEAVQTPSKTTTFLVIYHQAPVSARTHIFATSDIKAFNTDLLQRTKSGYRMIDYEKYSDGSQDNYICIYRRGDFDIRFVRDLDRSEFDGLWELQEKEGLFLVNMEVQ